MIIKSHIPFRFTVSTTTKVKEKLEEEIKGYHKL